MTATAKWQTLILAGTSPHSVDRAVDWLAAGEVVGLPTETVYGLAADVASERAIRRIFEAKERPLSDPLIVHLPSVDWLYRVARLSDGQASLTRQLVAQYWPGPLTLVLPRQAGEIGDSVTAGSSHVAVRMSANPVFGEVIEKFGRPLAAPSANRFGRISPTTAAHVLTELNGRIPLILDGGPTAHGLESTIVVPGEDGTTLRILRHGPITLEMLSRFGVAANAGGPASSAEQAAPGQMEGHYAPRTPLSLVERDSRDQFSGSGETLGFLGLREDQPPLAGEFARVEYLSRNGNLREAAANLFAALRRLDDSGVDRILAERIPQDDLGRAIMERLSRAAAGSGAGPNAGIARHNSF